MTTVGIVVSCAVFLSSVVPVAWAGTLPIELSSRSVPPGATLSISGQGFGTFQSAQVNRVTVSGVPALVQRWEPDLIEIKVPFNAAGGPVEIQAGKKKIAREQRGRECFLDRLVNKTKTSDSFNSVRPNYCWA